MAPPIKSNRTESTPTTAQVRMACAGLGWNWDDLTEAADVSRDTLGRFMRGAQHSVATVEAIRSALEKAGAEFIPDGVRVRALRRQPRNR